MGSSLPVLTYHAIVAPDGHGLALFERQLDTLVRSRLPPLQPGQIDTARSGFLLTFDDGFADLWSHVLEQLATRGLQALVFAVPARTGEGAPRLRNELAWNGLASRAHAEAVAAQAPHPAFLRWSELAALEASGRVTVQSHSYAHRIGWIGDRIVGFNLPRRRPQGRVAEDRPFSGGPAETPEGAGGAHWSLGDATGGDTRLGIPLYRRGSSLAHALYHDPPGLRDLAASWFEARGGVSYLRERGHRVVTAELMALVGPPGRARGGGGRWETRDERARRTVEDMASAREALERHLGGRRDELALPWGQYDALTLECARRAGIRRVYTMDRAPNRAGALGALVHRFRPRRRGPLWLRSRLWLHSSPLRTRLYRALSSSRPPAW